MPVWPLLDPIQQKEELDGITKALVDALSPGWRQLMIDFRAVGRNIDVAVGLTGPDGQERVWDPPAEVWRAFQRLRGGMYTENEGTWFSARYTLEPPSRFTIQYNYENQPDFQPPPAPGEFATEQERFPRDEASMPDWYRAGLEAARAEGN
ncbi:hypothetical protein [Amycolatopsis sp. NPDC004772]